MEEVATVFCPRCGAKNDATAVFCAKCAARIGLAADGSESYAQEVRAPVPERLQHTLRHGANWFFWIAGLTILSTGNYLLGSDFFFVVGLGATPFLQGLLGAFDAQLGGAAAVGRAIGVGVNLIAAALFVLFGYLSRKQRPAPMMTGMILYAADALLLLLLGLYLAVVLHAWALIELWAGWKALQQLGALKQTRAGSPIGTAS